MSTEEVETPVAENGSSEPKASSPKPQVKREKSSGDRDNRSRGGRDRRDRDRDRRYQPYGREGRGGGGGGRGSRGHGQDPERTVYISNIPYEMKWQDIKDLFRDKVGEVTYVEMFTDMDGKSRGCGIVEFKDKDAAKKAVDNLHKHPINGRNIIVREDSSGELQRRARIKNDQGMPGGDIGGGPMGMGGGMGNMGGGMGNMGGGMGNMGGGMGNMGGGMGNMGGGMGNMGGGMGNMGNSNVDPELMRRLNNGDISNVVFVANLDYKVTWKKLKDIFKMAGNVLRAEIKTDNEGKSRGHGTVTFEFPLEAAQAISMFNGQKLFDRTMVVRPDSKGPGEMGRDPGPKLPSGLSGIGAGLGPGGQPLNVHQMGSGGGGGGGMGGGMGGGSMGGGGMGGGMGGGLGGGMGGNMGGGMGNMGGMSDLGGNMGGMGGGMGNMGRDARLSVSTSREDIGRGTGGLGMGDLGGGGGMGMGGGMGNMGDSMGGMGGGMGSPGMGGGMGGGFGGGMGGGNMGGNMGGMGGMGNPMGGGMGGGGMGGGGGMMGGGMDNNMGRGGMGGGRNRSCQIFVRNLPWSFTWQMLKEKFKSCGRVMYAEIKMENGKSKGCGTVRFDTPEGAQRACDMMNGIKLDGREIDVRIDRSL